MHTVQKYSKLILFVLPSTFHKCTETVWAPFVITVELTSVHCSFSLSSSSSAAPALADKPAHAELMISSTRTQ
jgi:hypothetical protein